MYVYSVCQLESKVLGSMGPGSSRVPKSPDPRVPGPRSQVLGSTEYSVPTISGLLLNSSAHTIYGLCVWVGG